MRGTFGGWFEVEQPGRVAPLAVAVVIAVAVVSWLATLLWLLAAFLAVAVVIAAGGLVAIIRWNRRETGRFIERAAIFAEAAPKATVAAPPAAAALTVNHFHGGTHLHFGAGAADPRFIQAVPQQRDAITTEGTEET